jgi:methionyl-tRNA formyltransferase
VKVIFFGTPEFAVPSLTKLIESPDIEILAIITQPDKPVGRKQILTAPPIKILAEKNNLKIFQPEKLNLDRALIDFIKNSQVDFMITVAYGQIIKSEILEIAPIINVHASLLPYYRGPAPINWMIIQGEKEVGVTTMLTDIGVDTGDMLLKASTHLGLDEDAITLSNRLALMGADLLLETLNKFSQIKPEKQIYVKDRQLAPFMDKQLGLIDFVSSEMILRSGNPKQCDFKVVIPNTAANIHNLVRGVQPWPGAYFIYQGQKIGLTKTHLIDEGSRKNPGQIIEIKKDSKTFIVSTQQGLLEIITVKPEGKNLCSAFDWLNGQRLSLGDVITVSVT